MFYYDPAVLAESVDEDGEKVEAQETAASLKEKTAAIREKSPRASVLLRDATRFTTVESRVLGVVLFGGDDASCLGKVGKAYSEAEVPVASFSDIEEAAFDVEADDDEDATLAELKAEATELGLTFNNKATEQSLRLAIQQHHQEAGTGPVAAEDEDDDDDDGDDFDHTTADIDALKAYADKHDIDYASNIGEDTLRERVTEHVDANA